jgi:hypothetical protein
MQVCLRNGQLAFLNLYQKLQYNNQFNKDIKKMQQMSLPLHGQRESKRRRQMFLSGFEVSGIGPLNLNSHVSKTEAQSSWCRDIIGIQDLLLPQVMD